MRELRAVLLGVPPLLADIIRRTIAERLRTAGVALSIGDAAAGETAPDVMIIRQHASPVPRHWQSRAPVTLVLSDDLATLTGPGEDEVSDLTIDGLAAALVAIAGMLPPR